MLVDVYWNSRKRCYSVRHKGKVIHTVPFLTLAPAEFRVSAKGRDRVRQTGKKTVHAVIRGEVVGLTASIPENALQVGYNPYGDDEFMMLAVGKPIFQARMVVFARGYSSGGQKAIPSVWALP